MKKRGKKVNAVKEIKEATITDKTIKLLIRNNVELQKKLVLLATNVGDLTKKVGKVMTLIERASEDFIEKEEEGKVKLSKTSKSEKELIDKLEGLIKQNRTIARGLILLERYVREKTSDKKPRPEIKKEEGLEPQPLPEFKF